MAKRMLAMPIAGAIKAIEYYQQMVQEDLVDKNEAKDYGHKAKTVDIAYISELDLRKILGCYLISPADKGEELDLLEVFIAQLPHTKEPGMDSFFRRFRCDDVKSSLLSILKGTSSMSNKEALDDDDDFARQATYAESV